MQMCEVEPTTSQLSKDDSSDKMKRKKKNFEMDGFIISSCIMAQHFILFSLANTLCSWPVINWKLSIRISRDEQRIPFMIVRLFRSLTLAQTQTFFCQDQDFRCDWFFYLFSSLVQRSISHGRQRRESTDCTHTRWRPSLNVWTRFRLWILSHVPSSVDAVVLRSIEVCAFSSNRLKLIAQRNDGSDQLFNRFVIWKIDNEKWFFFGIFHFFLTSSWFVVSSSFSRSSDCHCRCAFFFFFISFLFAIVVCLPPRFIRFRTSDVRFMRC